jgi:hypothetical protein
MKKQMIKRADGSYSQRGLWDNIRANKGSGKKPTAQMLKQERKIKRNMADGGKMPTSVAKARFVAANKGNVSEARQDASKYGYKFMAGGKLKAAYMAKGGTIAKTTKGPGANYRPTKSGAGMTQKGVMAYRRANPGSKLSTAVTGKVKAGSKAAGRRKSYCARSLGQLRQSSQATQNDPNSRIRQARRRWKC